MREQLIGKNKKIELRERTENKKKTWRESTSKRRPGVPESLTEVLYLTRLVTCPLSISIQIQIQSERYLILGQIKIDRFNRLLNGP
uniref:Uncharacterized protein n=1 Tax=Rhizophora mucronata TaxID=61149 RepID=A0A2P2LR49_RHIMU